MRRVVGRIAVGLAALVALLVVAGAIAASTLRFDHASMPAEDKVLNAARLPPGAAFDVLGRAVSAEEAARLLATREGRETLSPTAGAVRIDDDLVRSGRDIFYRETFGNEMFLTDILGLLDGALTRTGFALALAELGGRGTTNLPVRLSRPVRIGDRRWEAGDTVLTGLDVPPGEWLPLGMRLFVDRGAVRVGVTCALCHARLDGTTGRVVEGAPNTDLDLGLLFAMAANPAALWPQTGLQSVGVLPAKPERFVRRSTEGSDLVPDRAPLAQVVRDMLALWPPGSVDTTADLVGNPTSIPTTFTRDAWPYGWSGQAAIGPFRGLASLSDAVHGLGFDATALAPIARPLLHVDTELYLATILQDAPRSPLRFEPGEGDEPSDRLAASDPTQGTPGLGRLAVLPGGLRANYVSAFGLVPIRPGEPIGRPMQALAAFQDRLRPPPSPASVGGSTVLGRDVFQRAGCLSCHSGPAGTSHRVWPADVIGTEPSRAAAFSVTEANVGPPLLFAPNTLFPASEDVQVLPVPIPDEGQLKLAWAHNATRGGYKVPSLVGLRWSAPYLHDGGVGAPAGASSPSPRDSLLALVDRTKRAAIVAANAADTRRVRARVTGQGHAYWADREAGYSEAEQAALVEYLLAIDAPLAEAATPAGR